MISQFSSPISATDKTVVNHVGIILRINYILYSSTGLRAGGTINVTPGQTYNLYNAGGELVDIRIVNNVALIRRKTGTLNWQIESEIISA